MSINASELLKYMLNGNRYKDSDFISISDGTLYWFNVPVLVLRPDMVEFCPATHAKVLALQRDMFFCMQEQGVLAPEEVFPMIQVLHHGGYGLPRRKPEPKFEPLTVPVCNDTRELL